MKNVMICIRVAFACLLSHFLIANAYAEQDSPFVAKDLLDTHQTWNGEVIQYPVGDKAKIKMMEFTIKANTQTPDHCHGVNEVIYILEGELMVETLDGKKKLLKQGDVAVEPLKTFHHGISGPNGVKLLATYIGTKDRPEAVMKNDNEGVKAFCS